MDVYKTFYRAYYEDMKEYFLEFHGEKYGLTEENYFEIVLEPTSIIEADFNKCDRKIKLNLPVSFKRYYATGYSLTQDIEIPTVTLAAAGKQKPFESLEGILFENEFTAIMLQNGLIPVGIMEGNFYTCLDTRAGDQYDMPITLYSLDDGDDLQSAISPRHWFSSFEKFILCMTDYIKTGTPDNFNTIDPGNHYLDTYS